MRREEPPQQQVFNRFHVKERIGSGGFGTVWRATDKNGGPDVAVKFPKTERNETNDAAEVRSRFRNEYRVLSQFEGGVVPKSMLRYVDGRRRDPMCLVLEYIEGKELSEYFSRRDVEPGMETARQFGFPVVRALEFLHRNDVCYLDCKPENVLVRDRDNEPVLIDFNTAEPAYSVDTLFYEDQYKAPEQTPSDRSTADSGPWSDVYAAGKLLCYLLTGESVLTSSTPSEGIDIRDYGADSPYGVRRVLQQATAADPTERPRDAGKLLTALYDSCGEETAVAELTDNRTDAVCLVRTGDTVGRIDKGNPLPDIAVADSSRYVSPTHFKIERDGGSWVIQDKSLNGTYIRTDRQWQQLLSADGYRRLKRETPNQAPNERPYTAGRLREQTAVAPVDPSYVVDLTFRPNTEWG